MAITLLLLDDSRTIHKVFELIYAGSDVVVLPEVDAGVGLAKARESKPAVVVIDCDLPGTDGYELCARIKADPQLAGVAVLVMGSVQHPLDNDRLAKSGADGSIVKPFVSNDLRAKVEAAIAAAAARPAAPPVQPSAAPVPPPASPAWQPSAAPVPPAPPPVAAPTWQPPVAAAPIQPRPVAPAVPPPPPVEAPPASEPVAAVTSEEFDWQSFIEGTKSVGESSIEEDLGISTEEETVEEEVSDSEAWDTTPEPAVEMSDEEALLGSGPKEEDLWKLVEMEKPAPSAGSEPFDLSAEEEPLELSEEDLFLEEVAEEPTETRKRLDLAQGGMEPARREEAPVAPEEPLEAPAPRELPKDEEAALPAGAGWYDLDTTAAEEPAVVPEEPPAAVFVPPTWVPPVPVAPPAPVPQPVPVVQAAPAAPAPPAAQAAPAETDLAAAVRAYLEGPGKEMIERIAWDVVPDLAEMIIRKEIERLKKEVGGA
jgi:CheY-like chemotaxis protein